MISPRPLDELALAEIVARDAPAAEQRRADLRAQLAANRTGALRLAELAARLGPDRLREATDAVLDYSERRTRACIARCRRARCGRGTCSRPPAATSSSPAGAGGPRRPSSSTSTAAPPSTTGNLNCPLAVTRSACLFAVRVLTDPDIPPTAGAYRPVTVSAPRRHAC